MIPDFVEIGGSAPWPVLPPGIHDATLDEVDSSEVVTAMVVLGQCTPGSKKPIGQAIVISA